MLAKRELPTEFRAWNKKWHAPAGRTKPRIFRRILPGFFNKYQGPFAYQLNSTTREFEYPWVYYQINGIGKNLSIIELGGCLSGLQFVLASEGHKVTNIDPGKDATGLGWDINNKAHSRLCQLFNAPVLLINNCIQDANIADNSVDVVYSVSAMEHFSQPDLDAAARHVNRVLKKHGVFIATIDLFIDIHPFTNLNSNPWGINVNICKFLQEAGLRLIHGNKEELYGYDQFSTNYILSSLPIYNMNIYYPVLAQCIVATKI